MKFVAKWTSMAAILTVATASLAAATNSLVDTSVKVVEYLPNQLLVQIPGSQVNPNYLALTTGTPTGCSNVSMDTLKIWANLSQAALLSGKTVRIYSCDINGNHYITAFDLNQ